MPSSSVCNVYTSFRTTFSPSVMGTLSKGSSTAGQTAVRYSEQAADGLYSHAAPRWLQFFALLRRPENEDVFDPRPYSIKDSYGHCSYRMRAPGTHITKVLVITPCAKVTKIYSLDFTLCWAIFKKFRVNRFLVLFWVAFKLDTSNFCNIVHYHPKIFTYIKNHILMIQRCWKWAGF